jgi:hypothetical protein
MTEDTIVEDFVFPQAYRDDSITVLRDRINRITEKSRNLEHLLEFIEKNKDGEHPLTPEADEALWSILVSRILD